MRHLLYKDEDFCIEYEYNENNCVFAHCLVNNYNKKIKKTMRIVWKLLSRTLNKQYIYIATTSKKTGKFAQLFGFSYLKEIDGYDIYRYEVK